MTKKETTKNQWQNKPEKDYTLTNIQFFNILTFIVIFSNSYEILTESPDYIIEKYKRYIGDPSLVTKTPEGGLHEILITNLIEPYKKRWGYILKDITDDE